MLALHTVRGGLLVYVYGCTMPVARLQHSSCYSEVTNKVLK